MAIDQFGEDVGFIVADGSRTKNTVLGTLMSSLILIVTLVYGYSKYNDLQDKVDTSYQEVPIVKGMTTDPVDFSTMKTSIFASVHTSIPDANGNLFLTQE